MIAFISSRIPGWRKSKAGVVPGSYWGKIGPKLVESEHRYIVYNLRGVLFSSNSFDEAADFLRQEVATGCFVGNLYQHAGRTWQPVPVAMTR